MDVNNSSQDDGANVQIWNYWSGTTQQWQIIEQETGIYQLKARHSGKCLDVSDTTNGANVRQWTCNGNESQQFLLTLADYNPVMSPDYNQEMIKIYPNPALDFFFIDEENYRHVIITDLSGKEFLIDMKEGYADVSRLEPGYYILRLLTGDYQIIVKRFIKL